MLRHGPRVGISRERLEQVEGFFDRHGGPTILLGRFVGIVRAIAPFVLGSSKLAFKRFLPYDVVGAGLWAAALLLLGYVFWHSLAKAVDIAKQGALALGAVIAVVVAIVAAWRYWHKPENRAKTRRWLDEQARKPAIAPVVRAARPVWRRLAGPARGLGNRLTPGDLGLEVTSLVAVLLVGAFTFVGLTAAVDNGAALGFDPQAFDAGADLRTGWLTSVAKVVTALGSLPLVGAVLVVGVGFLALRRDVTGATTVAVGSVLTYAAVHIVKATENRPRPPAPLIEAAGSSFPSAHAAYSVAYVAAAVAIARALPNWTGRTVLVTGAVVLAMAIGLSRVYLRAHYLSDVLAGWGLAAAIFALCGLIAVIVVFMRQNEAARA
jgi:undecaprenyl-diphosphatase